jgi:serine/threonine protein kinase
MLILLQIPADKVEQHRMEVKVLQEIKKKGVPSLAELITSGTSSTGQHYIVMERYGISLKDVEINSKLQRFSIKSVVQIGIHFIDRLKGLHECGFIHNDIKLENILVGSIDKNQA